MHLVQLLLPLMAPDGKPFPRAFYRQVREVLTERFGGLTAYTRAPAEGRWRAGGAGTTRDEIIVYEVMTYPLDPGWWRDYRTQLEQRFAQDRIAIRAQSVTML